MEFTGGCVCGGTRYVLKSRPITLVDCHCVDCRRSAGAPYVQWGSVPRADVVVTKGEPRKIVYENRIRSFAACCGTHLFFEESDFPRRQIAVGCHRRIDSVVPDSPEEEA